MAPRLGQVSAARIDGRTPLLISSALLTHEKRRECYQWLKDNDLRLRYIHCHDTLDEAIAAPKTSTGISSVMVQFVHLEDYVLFRLRWSDR